MVLIFIILLLVLLKLLLVFIWVIRLLLLIYNFGMRGSDVDVILIDSFIAVIIEFAYIIGFKNMGFISIESSIAIMEGFVYSRNLV